MGLIIDSLYKLFPEFDVMEKKIEKTIDAGKEVIDDFRKGVSYGKNFVKNADDYISSGKPLGHIDRAMDTLTKGMNKAFTDAFKDMKDEFANTYGPLGSGRAHTPVETQPITTPLPGSGEGARRFFVDPKGNVEVRPAKEDYSGGNGKGNGKQQASQPYEGHKPLGHDYMKDVLRDMKEAKPAEQPVKPVTKEQIAAPKPVVAPQPRPVMNPEARPVDKPVEKQLTLDSIVEDFKRKLRQLSPDIDAGVEVYAPGGLLQSYASKYSHGKAKEVGDIVADAVDDATKIELKAELKPEAKVFGLESKVSALKEKYDVKSSNDVLDLYNKGYKTKDIIKESAKNGYQVKSYKDIISNVAAAIGAGAAYVRSKYNNLVATALGATEQVIKDYLSGKSYAQIKENLKKNTNGMKVSDSTILRVMHNYEKKTGTKVVGNRNGQGAKAAESPGPKEPAGEQKTSSEENPAGNEGKPEQKADGNPSGPEANAAEAQN